MTKTNNANINVNINNANIDNDTIIKKCEDCGQVYYTCSYEYMESYPTGYDMSVEQAWAYHVSHKCPHGRDYDHTEDCPHCGQEMVRLDYEYWVNYPWGSSQAAERQREEHLRDCPVLWSKWYKKAGVPKDTTVNKAIRTVLFRDGLKAAQSLPEPPHWEESYHGEWKGHINQVIWRAIGAQDLSTFYRRLSAMGLDK